jgi:hypothetical protein
MGNRINPDLSGKGVLMGTFGRRFSILELQKLPVKFLLHIGHKGKLLLFLIFGALLCSVSIKSLAGPGFPKRFQYSFQGFSGENLLSSNLYNFIPENSQFEADTLITYVTCKGANNGTITLIPRPGFTYDGYELYSLPSYTFIRSQTSPTFTGLAPGQYEINLVSSDGGFAEPITPITILEPNTALNFSGSLIISNIGCSGGGGSVSGNAVGGWGGYTYSINGTTYQSSNTFTNLAAGAYTYYIKDARGCVISRAFSISTSVSVIGTITSQTNVLCNGQSNGSVTVSGSNGTAPYTYSRSGGPQNQASGTFSGLAVGTYTITVRDAAGCTANVPVTITQPAALNVPAASANQPICEGNTLNVASGTVTGGVAPYQYAWKKFDGPFTATGPSFSIPNIQMSDDGRYDLTVTDANGCTALRIRQVNVTMRPSVDWGYNPPANEFCANDNELKVPSFWNTRGAWQTIRFRAEPNGLSIDSVTGALNPSTSLPNSYQAIGTIPAAGGCPAIRDTIPVKITGVPTASFTYNGAPFCSNDNTSKPVTMTGTFAYLGGTFSAPAGLVINPATGSIIPQAPGTTPGSYQITYTTLAGGGCPAFTYTGNVTITALPVINAFTYPNTPYCSNESMANVSLNASKGGSFSSTSGLAFIGGSGNVNITNSTPGAYVVTFRIGAADGCPEVSATTGITITPLPNATINYSPNPICPTNAAAPVTLTGSTGGVFSGNLPGLVINPTTGAINGPASTVGDYEVRYTFAPAGGCPLREFTRAIAVRDITPPVVTAPPIANVQCQQGTLPAVTGTATATDNCTPVGSLSITYTDEIIPQGCAYTFQVRRTWRATDLSGNTGTALQIINVADNVKPTISATNLTVANPNLVPERGTGITFSDNCTPTPQIQLFLFDEVYPNIATDPPGFCPSRIHRFFYVMDLCGNSSDTIMQVINVQSTAGCGVCQSGGLFFPINLFGAPDSTWISPDRPRSRELCCLPTPDKNDRCVSFNVFLDRDAVGLIFDIPEGPQFQCGAKPSGAMFYQVDCGPPVAIGTPICLVGGRFYTVTFCKPGNNPNCYLIRSIAGGVAAKGLTTRVNCSKEISVTGLIENTIRYRDITSGDGRFTRFLSDSIGKSLVLFNPDSTAPNVIRYSVCGNIAAAAGGCTNSLISCDTVTVNVLREIRADIPIQPDQCINNPQPVTASVTPLGLQYTYDWYSGPGGTGTLMQSGTSNVWTPSANGNYSLVVTETGTGLGCNTSTFNFSVAFDAEPPVLNVPANLTLQCKNSENAFNIANWLALATASDNVRLANPNGFFNNYAPIAESCGANQTVLFTARDHCGFTANRSSIIQFIDTIPPAISCPSNLQVACATDVPAAYAGRTAFLNAGGNILDVCDPSPSLSLLSQTTQNPLNCPNDYSITRIYRTLDQCNNANVCEQTITVRSSTLPVVPVNGQREVDCLAEAVIPTPPTVIDICGSAIVPTMTQNDNPACDGAKIYSFTYRDCSGLQSIWTYSYVINNRFSFPNPPGATATVSCPTQAIAPTVFPEVRDYCGNLLQAEFIGESSAPICNGTKTFNYRYRDCSGRTQPWSFTYTIQIPAPTITAPGTLSFCELASKTYTIPAITAVAACSASPNVTFTISGATSRTGSGLDASGLFNLGASTITWRVTDLCGNQSTATTTVTVNPAPSGSLTGNILVCPGTPVTIGVNVAGTGTVTGTLSPGNIPFSGTAPLINVVVNPAATTVYTIGSLTLGGCAALSSAGSFTVTIPSGPAGLWTGLFDENWFDCRNWANGVVPDATTNVTLPAAATRNCEIDQTKGDPAYCRDITIAKPFRFTNAGRLEVYGNWLDNLTASFQPGNGTVLFRGSTPQTINTAGDPERFFNLTINNTSGSNAAIALQKRVQVAGILDLTNGRVLTTATNLMVVTNTARGAILGGSPQSFINGPLRRHFTLAGEYFYPIGKPGGPYADYRPAIVDGRDDGNLVFDAEYRLGPTPNSGEWGGAIGGVLNTEYWQIDRTGGTGQARVKLFYITPSASNHWTITEPPGYNFAVAVVKETTSALGPIWYFTDVYSVEQHAGFDGELPEAVSWTYYPVPGVGVYSKFMNEFSPFTFGYAFFRVLPVKLRSFTGMLQDKQGLLLWTVADNNEVEGFDVEHGTDGQNFRLIGKVGAGNSINYRFTHTGLTPGNNYYRLAMRGKDGSRLYSNVVVIPFGVPATSIVGLQPTVVRDMTQLSVVSARPQTIQVRLLDMGGRLIRTEKAALQAGNNMVPIYTRGLSAAMYSVHVLTEDGVQANYKILKE